MDDKFSSPQPHEEFTPEEVEKAFNEFELEAGDTQEKLSNATQYVGYTKKAMSSVKPFYIQLAQLAQDEPQLQPIVASSIKFISALGNEVKRTREEVDNFVPGLSGMAGSANYFVSTSQITGAIVTPDVNFVWNEPPPFFDPAKKDTENKLAKIDLSLADTYRAVGQAYQGTTADLGRAAIGLMRQTFDHLFDKLAPDDEVRQSPYWTVKTGDKPDQVFRKERITYAVHKHISDSSRAATMIEGIDNILEAYQILNSLHKRGILSEKQITAALNTLKKFLDAWADAATL